MSTIRKKFIDYTVNENGSRDVRESVDELDREIAVRKKIYDRWVTEGKVSWTEAHDRLERLLTLVKLLLSVDEDDLQRMLDNAKPALLA